MYIAYDPSPNPIYQGIKPTKHNNLFSALVQKWLNVSMCAQWTVRHWFHLTYKGIDTCKCAFVYTL